MLKTIVKPALTVGSWVEIATGPIAVIDMQIYNRGYSDGFVLIALRKVNYVQLNPPQNLTAQKVGTHTGTETYSYKVTACDSLGETTPNEITIQNCNSVLDSLNYVSLSWQPVEGALKYRVYGRSPQGEVLLAETTNTSFDDKMTDYIGEPLPVANTTGLEAILFEGVLESKAVLEVVRKLLIENGIQLVAFTNAENINLLAFAVSI